MIKDRLVEFMSVEQISASRLAEVMDVQASSISHIISGRNKPGFDFLVKLFEAYPTLNPKWLMMGRGRMFSSTGSIQSNDTQKLENANEAEAREEFQLSLAMDETVKNSRNVEKVMLFFSDNTFETFVKE